MTIVWIRTFGVEQNWAKQMGASVKNSIKKAHKRLEKAKQSGRNTVHSFEIDIFYLSFFGSIRMCLRQMRIQCGEPNEKLNKWATTDMSTKVSLCHQTMRFFFYHNTHSILLRFNVDVWEVQGTHFPHSLHAMDNWFVLTSLISFRLLSIWSLQAIELFQFLLLGFVLGYYWWSTLTGSRTTLSKTIELSQRKDIERKWWFHSIRFRHLCAHLFRYIKWWIHLHVFISLLVLFFVGCFFFSDQDSSDQHIVHNTKDKSLIVYQKAIIHLFQMKLMNSTMVLSIVLLNKGSFCCFTFVFFRLSLFDFAVDSWFLFSYFLCPDNSMQVMA